MGNPPFIDIHVHPDIKTFLTADEERCRYTCWESVQLTPLIKLIDQILLDSILEPQCSLTQLNHSPGSLAIVGLGALEKEMVKGDLVRILGFHVDLLTIARILARRGQTGILNYTLLKRISPWRYNYYKLFKEELVHFVASKSIVPKYNILKGINEYNREKLNIVLTIEGGHNLFNKTFSFRYKRHVLDNLKELKNGDNQYLFISLAHLARNRLATHAYGMKYLHDRRFKPVGFGIRKLGREVIRIALSKPNRILIDIKHLSLESRKQYYEILKTEYIGENIPIIASHMGVAGVSYNKMPVVKCRCIWRWKKVLYSKPEGLPGTDTKFNPWSVNLYDEEIKTIIDSNGLIGLSLDERILGAKQQKKSQLTEYFSCREFSCSKYRHNLHANDPEQETRISSEEQRMHEIEEFFRSVVTLIIANPQLIQNLEEMLEGFAQEYRSLQASIARAQPTDNGIKHLCNNILHIVRVAGSKGLKHISIGSDFDGYVEAIKECKNATKYNKLAVVLKKWLPEMASHDTSLPPLNNIDQIVDDIMFGNAYEFLRANFT